jgi:hypothetical protein
VSSGTMKNAFWPGWAEGVCVCTLHEPSTCSAVLMESGVGFALHFACR